MLEVGPLAFNDPISLRGTILHEFEHLHHTEKAIAAVERWRATEPKLEFAAWLEKQLEDGQDVAARPRRDPRAGLERHRGDRVAGLPAQLHVDLPPARRWTTSSRFTSLVHLSEEWTAGRARGPRRDDRAAAGLPRDAGRAASRRAWTRSSRRSRTSPSGTGSGRELRHDTASVPSVAVRETPRRRRALPRPLRPRSGRLHRHAVHARRPAPTPRSTSTPTSRSTPSRVALHFPPGLVGNPNAADKCPVATFENGVCPAAPASAAWSRRRGWRSRSPATSTTSRRSPGEPARLGHLGPRPDQEPGRRSRCGPTAGSTRRSPRWSPARSGWPRSTSRSTARS